MNDNDGKGWRQPQNLHSQGTVVGHRTCTPLLVMKLKRCFVGSLGFQHVSTCSSLSFVQRGCIGSVSHVLEADCRAWMIEDDSSPGGCRSTECTRLSDAWTDKRHQKTQKLVPSTDHQLINSCSFRSVN